MSLRSHLGSLLCVEKRHKLALALSQDKARLEHLNVQMNFLEVEGVRGLWPSSKCPHTGEQNSVSLKSCRVH